MKFITLFAGALAATTAANIFLASDAYAVDFPNGWTQMGKKCSWGNPNPSGGGKFESTQTYYKLIKTGTTGTYGVYNSTKSEWVIKDVTKEAANAKMNSKCQVNTYQPT